jgi:hypothetical protein
MQLFACCCCLLLAAAAAATAATAAVYTPSFKMKSLLTSSPLALLVGFLGLADPINSNVNSDNGRTSGVDSGL